MLWLLFSFSFVRPVAVSVVVPVPVVVFSVVAALCALLLPVWPLCVSRVVVL